MKDVYITDFAAHEDRAITSFFVATQKQVRTKKDGSPYLALILTDKTGQVEARMWDNVPECIPLFEQGEVVKVRAVVCRFDGRLQLKVERIRRAPQGEFDLGDFLPKTTKDVDELWRQLTNYVDSFHNPHLKALLNAFLEDEQIAAALRNAPAAKGMHHAWIGGLLEHIVSLMGIADLAAGHYPEINRDLLLTGVMLHDIGKLRELSWTTGFSYTMEGQLLGHITIGIGMVEKKLETLPDFPPKLRLLVEHMILSHHGQYEFGSPKLPMIPEAVLLHYLDDMDAKMQTIRSELERSAAQGKSADQFTDWVRAMERALLSTSGFLADEAGETDKSEAGESKEV
ncbi:MAG TPA: HD domain-containing protein [Acidisarcina sp.]|nr:HD domain-containing protein [Acidisarcina sp.]